MDRKTPPYATLPASVNIPRAEEHSLANGIKVFVVNKGEVDVCRIDFLFSAGSREQVMPLQASGTLSLITEGTQRFTAQQIAEKLEHLGSYVNRSTYSDFARLSLFALNRNLEATMALLEEVIKRPTFPNHEIDIWRTTGRQELSVSLKKTATLAQRRFIQTLFGDKHPYGVFASPTDYDSIVRENFTTFHREHLACHSCRIFVSGRVTDEHLKLLNRHFGQEHWGEKKSETPPICPEPLSRQQFVYKPTSVQSSIRVGRILFARNHPDYAQMAILTSLLGGFFGSRLMKNLREDKGYTYGVHATIMPFAQANVLQIGTDVGTIHTGSAIEEIFNEINRLKNEPVPDDELLLVKGSLIGQFLRTLNGQFSIADSLVWLLYLNNMDYGFYHNMLHAINNVTSDQLAEQANRWLNQPDMAICVAGDRNPFG